MSIESFGDFKPEMEGAQSPEQILASLQTRVSGETIRFTKEVGALRATPGHPREIEPQLVDAEVSLRAAKIAESVLRSAEFSTRAEPQFGKDSEFHRDVLLDIPEADFAGRTRLEFRPDGIAGLEGYFEEHTRPERNNIVSNESPLVASRVMPYLYTMGYKNIINPEAQIRSSLSKLKPGEKVIQGTDVENVYIEYSRVAESAEKDNRYQKQHLRMTAVVQYGKGSEK